MGKLDPLFYKPPSSSAGRIAKFLMGGPDLSDGLQKETTGVFSEVAEEILLPALRDKLEENGSVFTGGLRDSLRVYATEKTVHVVAEGGYSRILENGSDARVMSDEEYAQMPAWVIHKGLVDASDRGAAQLVADRIVDKIQAEGSNPHPFLAPVLDECRPILEERAKRKLIFRLRG